MKGYVMKYLLNTFVALFILSLPADAQTLVRSTLIPNSGPGTWPSCVVSFPAIGVGNTAVAYLHTASFDDTVPMAPHTVTDNAGNVWNQTASLQWQPWPEDITITYLTNVHGSPTSLTIDFSQYPNFGPTNTPSCNVGLSEYSNTAGLVVFGPTPLDGSMPTFSYAPSSPSLVWLFAADFSRDETLIEAPHFSALQTLGYTGIIDNWDNDDIGVWQSNKILSGTQSVTFNSPQPSNWCGFFAGCQTVVAAVALKPSSGPPPPIGPTVSLSANPQTITPFSHLSWTSMNADSCTTSGFSGSGTNGSATVKPGSTTTYSITCKGPGGSATAKTTVTVVPP
jgi:hypothetical protein